MALRLNLSGGGLGRQSRTLASGTLSIGRGDRNDWVLPDPDRHLSKTHCMLSVENGQYVLTDLSTNGVTINGARTPTSRDSRVVLTDGDEFRIGDYSVTVEEVAGGAAASPGFGEDTDPLSIDPLADPLGRPRDESFSHPVRHTAQIGRAGRDPFDMQDEAKHRTVLPEEDIFAGRKPEKEWTGPSQADNADANRHAMLRGRVTTPQRSADVDFDALIGDMSSVLGPATPAPAPSAYRAPPPAARPPAADPFGGFDDLMPPPPAARAPSPPAPPLAPATPPPRPASADPFGGFDDLMSPPPPAPPPEPVPPAPRTAPPPSPESLAPAPRAAPPPRPAAEPGPNPFDTGSSHELPRPAAPSSPAPAPAAPTPGAPTPGAPTSAAPPSAGNAQSGLDAFLQGANITRAQTGDDPEAALRAAGQVFRVLVEGLREVLMSRAAIKSEMRIEGTLIRSSNNNPLKFSFNPDEAVIALLGTERPGYMPPLRAAKEAFDDIKNHEVAVMAGVQTALRGLLERFSPDTLEARLTQGLLTSMLPGARKARLWENFRELHKTIAAEAQDDFQKVFGAAFADAYISQSRKDGS